ncbi:MAG: hypothetical protein ACFB0C_24085 [Leptolyngbyaceae cyanobacterium]
MCRWPQHPHQDDFGLSHDSLYRHAFRMLWQEDAPDHRPHCPTRPFWTKLGIIAVLWMLGSGMVVASSGQLATNCALANRAALESCQHPNR